MCPNFISADAAAVFSAVSTRSIVASKYTARFAIIRNMHKYIGNHMLTFRSVNSFAWSFALNCDCGGAEAYYRALVISLLNVRRTVKSYALYVIMLLYKNIYMWLLCTVVLIFEIYLWGIGGWGTRGPGRYDSFTAVYNCRCALCLLLIRTFHIKASHSRPFLPQLLLPVFLVGLQYQLRRGVPSLPILHRVCRIPP